MCTIWTWAWDKIALVFALSSHLPISLRHSRFYSRPLPPCNWSTSILWALASIRILGTGIQSRKMNILLTDFLKEESLHYWMLYALIRETEVAAITWLCVETILPLRKAEYTRTKKSYWHTDYRGNEAQLPERALWLEARYASLNSACTYHVSWSQWKMLPGTVEFRLNAQNNDYLGTNLTGNYTDFLNLLCIYQKTTSE